MKKAYTLGHQGSYDQALHDALLTGTPERKIGMHPPSPEYPEGYSGGWVWKTAQEAEAFRQKHETASPMTYTSFGSFAVYELELEGTWDTDVNVSPGRDGVHNLLKDARLVRRVEVSLPHSEAKDIAQGLP